MFAFRTQGYVLKSGKRRTDGKPQDMNNGQHNEMFFFFSFVQEFDCYNILCTFSAFEPAHHRFIRESFTFAASVISASNFTVFSHTVKISPFVARLSDVLKLKPGFRQWFSTPLSALGGLGVLSPAP